MSVDLSIRIVGFTEANQNITQLTNGLKDLANAQNAANSSSKQSQPLNEEQIRQTIQAKIEKQNLISTVKNEVVINSAAEGSYKRLSAELVQLKNQYKALSEEERNSASGNAMLNNIKEQDVNIKKLSASMGEHQREVGNYAEGVKKGVEGLKDLNAESITSGEGVSKLGSMLSKLGPIGIGVGVAVGALVGVMKTFYAGTQEGMDRMEIRTKGLGAAWDVLTGHVAQTGKAIDNAVGGDKPIKLGTGWTTFFKILDDSITQLVGTQVTNMQKMGSEMDKAAFKAKQIAYDRIQLEKEEISLISQRAKASEALTRARLEANDENKTISEKIELNKKVVEQENEIAGKEIESAEKNLALLQREIQMKKDVGKETRALDKEEEEAKADIYNKEQESERRKLKLVKENNQLEKELRQEQYDFEIAVEKGIEEKRMSANNQILESDKSTLEQKISAEKSNLQETLKMLELEKKAKLAALSPGADNTKIKTVIQETANEEFKVKEELEKKVLKMREDYEKKQLENSIKENEIKYNLDIKGAEQSFDNLKITKEKYLENVKKIDEKYEIEETNLLKEQVKNNMLTQDEYNQKVLDLKQKLSQDETAIAKKAEEEEKKHDEELLKSQSDYLKAKQELLNSQLANNKISLSQYNQEMDSSDADEQQKEIDDVQKKGKLRIEQGVETEKQLQEQVDAIKQKYIDKAHQRDVEYWTNLLNTVSGDINKMGQIATNFFNAAITNEKTRVDAENKQVDDQTANIISNLEQQKNYGLITAQEEATEKQNIEKHALEQKQANQAKLKQMQKEDADLQFVLSIAKITINGIEAISKDLAKGSPLNIPLIVMDAALSASEIAEATAQRTKAQSLEVGGYIQGNSHANGGVPIVAEGGEFVVRKSVMSNPVAASQVNAINQSGALSAPQPVIDYEKLGAIIAKNANPQPVLFLDDFHRKDDQRTNIQVQNTI